MTLITFSLFLFLSLYVHVCSYLLSWYIPVLFFPLIFVLYRTKTEDFSWIRTRIVGVERSRTLTIWRPTQPSYCLCSFFFFLLLCVSFSTLNLFFFSPFVSVILFFMFCLVVHLLSLFVPSIWFIKILLFLLYLSVCHWTYDCVLLSFLFPLPNLLHSTSINS